MQNLNIYRTTGGYAEKKSTLSSWSQLKDMILTHSLYLLSKISGDKDKPHAPWNE
jgi:hypothetical protein